MASFLPENSAAGVSGDDPGQDEEVRSKPASGERGMSSIIKLYVQGIGWLEAWTVHYKAS